MEKLTTLPSEINTQWSAIDSIEKSACICGEILKGEDEQPYRHQVVEIPEIELSIILSKIILAIANL